MFISSWKQTANAIVYVGWAGYMHLFDVQHTVPLGAAHMVMSFEVFGFN